MLFGDSLSREWIAEGVDGWFTRANTDDFTRVNKVALVANEGVSSDTTSLMLARIDDVRAHNPDVVHVLGGTNDLSAGVSSATIISNLDAIYTTLIADGVTVIAGTAGPSDSTTGAGVTEQETVNDWIKAQSSRAYVADYNTAVSVGGLGDELDDAYHDDGVHWNTAGRQVVADVLAPILDAL